MLQIVCQLVVTIVILSAGHVLFGLGLFAGFLSGFVLVFFVVLFFGVALGHLRRRLFRLLGATLQRLFSGQRIRLGIFLLGNLFNIRLLRHGRTSSFFLGLLHVLRHIPSDSLRFGIGGNRYDGYFEQRHTLNHVRHAVKLRHKFLFALQHLAPNRKLVEYSFFDFLDD